MISLAAWLYIVGYLLVIVSVLIAVPVSKRAIARMGKEAQELWTFKRETMRRLQREARETEEAGRNVMTHSDIESAANAAVEKRAEEKALPWSHGMRFGGSDTNTVISAIRQVGRANRATAALALSGGLLSTIASVLSLYVS